MLSDTAGSPLNKVEYDSTKDAWLVDYTPDDAAVSSFTLLITEHARRETKFIDVPI